jgi:hypothetical protein
MKRDPAIQKARRIHADLERNADDIHFDRVTWETFEARNRDLWDEAETDRRVKSMVLGLLREDPNWKNQED